MSPQTRSASKALIQPLVKALYDYDETTVRAELDRLLTPDAIVHVGHPFGDFIGADAFFAGAIAPLAVAFPDLERRDTILMAGWTEKGAEWIGACGYYTGTFANAFLDIPPTGHIASLRFHEFYRIDDGRVSEIQILWDAPELMMQANAWPMSPSLGRIWHVPGPASEDGLSTVNQDDEHAARSLALVSAMLVGLTRYASEGVEGMALEKYWSPRCSWYGPAGIGSCRGIEGFRNWHQIPFLNAMPDRVGTLGKGDLFGDGAYVGFTAWPGMRATITGDGWLGIAPSGQQVTMRSLDFWRCEAGLIRENWVLVDLLDVYSQIGVDVLARMREFNKAWARG